MEKLIATILEMSPVLILVTASFFLCLYILLRHRKYHAKNPFWKQQTLIEEEFTSIVDFINWKNDLDQKNNPDSSEIEIINFWNKDKNYYRYLLYLKALCRSFLSKKKDFNRKLSENHARQSAEQRIDEELNKLLERK